ncbi:MAG: HAMP domain-containing histidine kinase [Alistipes sp.]|nr:HAMP domain-containing histidine kinase [Alistipes sp.]
MQFIYRIALRLTAVLLPLMAVWGALFYFTMVDEIRDEADDALEDYSAMIISRILAGEALPQENDGSNNSFEVHAVDSDYAATHPHLSYRDENIYIPDKREKEPARVLTSIFSDAEGQFYELMVMTPTFEKNDLFEAVLGWIVVLYVALLVIVLTITMIIFRRGLQPLYDLLHWLDAYRPGGRPERVPNNTDVEEFRRLNVALQQAVDRSEELFERQSQFIGNASHELQTPLAIIGNRVEWLLDSTTITEEEAGELFKIKKTLSRAVRLNKTLLLLTKIDNGQFPESVEVDLVQMIRESAESYGDVYAEREVSVTQSLPAEFKVEMNESLAATLVTNLIKNAFVHSSNGSEVHISIAGRTLTISNAGEEPLDKEHIFERFYQAARKEGSTGLGLALVATICRYYNLRLEYFFADGKHHFEVEF